MSEAVHEYHPGDMNIAEQVSTYDAFGRMTKWGSLAIAVLVVMLVMWFCVRAGFFGGAVPGAILLALGITFLSSKPQAPHKQPEGAH